MRASGSRAVVVVLIGCGLVRHTVAQDTWTGWVDVDSGFGGDDVHGLDFFDGCVASRPLRPPHPLYA